MRESLCENRVDMPGVFVCISSVFFTHIFGVVNSVVDKLCGFTAYTPQVIRLFLHTGFTVFTSVPGRFLPIIHTTNNDNNYLNIPILLSGGCV